MKVDENATREILEGIYAELINMNIMQAMKMSHDTTRAYSDKEMDYLDNYADTPFCEEDEAD